MVHRKKPTISLLSQPHNVYFQLLADSALLLSVVGALSLLSDSKESAGDIAFCVVAVCRAAAAAISIAAQEPCYLEEKDFQANLLLGRGLGDLALVLAVVCFDSFAGFQNPDTALTLTALYALSIIAQILTFLHLRKQKERRRHPFFQPPVLSPKNPIAALKASPNTYLPPPLTLSELDADNTTLDLEQSEYTNNGNEMTFDYAQLNQSI